MCISEALLFAGNKDSGELEISVKVVGNGYLMIPTPYSDIHTFERIHGDELIKMKEWFHLTSKDEKTGKKKEIECLEPREVEKVWTVQNDPMIFGCVVKMEKGKHLIGISVDTNHTMPFWMFVSY